ncbi:MAG: polyribonucleotide nucleotidyltransferase, partial [Candidatus Brennerbacteria bacterium CG23_combo_of_CG06-09_8_20_14_all_44_41]
MIIMHISKDKIGDVIGPGGKIIRGITERTGASIDIEEDGTIFVTGENKDSAQQAVDIIQGLTKEFTVGEIVDGTVVKILDFGAVVEIGPNAEG